MNANDDNRNEIKAELEAIAPTLSKIKRDNPFEVPEGYFENLPRLVSDRIKEHSTSHTVPIRTLVVRWTAIAASIALIAAVAFVLNNNTAPTVNTDLALLDAEEIAEALVSDGAYAVDEEDLVEMLIEEDEFYAGDEESSSDDIIDYLIDNDIDLSTIINEL